MIKAPVTPRPIAATRSSARLRPSARCLGDGWNDGRNTGYLETARVGLRGELSGSALGSPPRTVRGLPLGDGSPVLTRGGSATDDDTSRDGSAPWDLGQGACYHPRPVAAVRVRSCGDAWFRQGLVTGEREPRMPLGLVNQVAKRSTWQPPVDSRPRCLGSKVSVEATSASWVVEASLSEAAIRTSVT